jgi:uncharacterized phage-associated protein
MPTAADVAQYIVSKTGPISAIKLQKLVYYAQAWSLVWDDAPLFDDAIEAWANGPVVPNLFYKHQGQFTVKSISGGDPAALSPSQQETVNVVITDYGDKSAQWLVELTHLEDPWKEARGNCLPGRRCSNVISHAAMAEYYSGLLP